MEVAGEDQDSIGPYDGMNLRNTERIPTMFMVLKIWKPSHAHSQRNALLVQFLPNTAQAHYGLG